MRFIYNILANTAEKILPATGFFSPKMELFVKGRENIFDELQQKISPEDKTIWFHAASLGEYEQAVPVIGQVKKIFPKHLIVLTFFSPSGYEVKKNSALADVVTYLPLDTSKNARKFFDLVHPEWAVFIKYEFWPNFLYQLKKRKIRTILVSGVFRENQVFFKPYGSWMRKYLEAFEHFFLQNESSKKLLNQLGFTNATVSGDTRFDRVTNQLQQDNKLDFIEEFKDGKTCVVAGSTWPEDDALLVDFINNSPQDVKFIIAPHALKPEKIKQLQQQLSVATMLFSEKEGKQLANHRVFIIDTVGLLSRIYSYADIAYVGGAAGDTGLHNILEPATFGLPIIIGKNFQDFPEAITLQELGGLFSVSQKSELNDIMDKLLKNNPFRRKTGEISRKFIVENRGATEAVSNYLLKFSNS